MTLLYEGRQIYFGPSTRARDYFVDMGFHCPERQTTADFLTSLTNPAERIIQPGAEKRVPKTPEEFALAWKQSRQRSELLREIETFEKLYPIDGEQTEKFISIRKEQQARWT